MVSSPSAQRSSVRVENTGSRSREPSSRSAAPHSGLSRSASSAITSQRSVAKDVNDGLHRSFDLLVRVRERDEYGLELGGCDVDAALEQPAEEHTVKRRVAAERVVEVPDRVRSREQGEHRADALHPPVRAKPTVEPRGATFQPLVDRRVAKPL